MPRRSSRLSRHSRPCRAVTPAATNVTVCHNYRHGSCEYELPQLPSQCCLNVKLLASAGKVLWWPDGHWHNCSADACLYRDLSVPGPSCDGAVTSPPSFFYGSGRAARRGPCQNCHAHKFESLYIGFSVSYSSLFPPK